MIVEETRILMLYHVSAACRMAVDKTKPYLLSVSDWSPQSKVTSPLGSGVTTLESAIFVDIGNVLLFVDDDDEGRKSLQANARGGKCALGH